MLPTVEIGALRLNSLIRPIADNCCELGQIGADCLSPAAAPR